MFDMYAWGMIAVIAIVTAITRFLPFMVFGSGVKTPKLIEKLGRVLPFAIMGMLVVYCMRGISFSSFEGFLPALLSCVLVVILHAWRRNTTLSVISGTVFYMIMVQLVF